MTELLQCLDRAVERGWANRGHIAEMRELAAALHAPQPFNEAQAQLAVDTYTQFLCEPPAGLKGSDLLREAIKAAAAAASRIPAHG